MATMKRDYLVILKSTGSLYDAINACRREN
jgi:hypothetical protein